MVNKIDKALIKHFCKECYKKIPDKFSTYCDWEPYWIISGVQIPLSTVQKYNELRHTYPDSALQVNSNWTLIMGRLQKRWFVKL